MITVLCLGFWMIGVGTGLFMAWLYVQLQDER